MIMASTRFGAFILSIPQIKWFSSLQAPGHFIVASQLATTIPTPTTRTRIYVPQNTKRSFMAHLLAGQLRHYSRPFCLLNLCDKPHRKWSVIW